MSVDISNKVQRTFIFPFKGSKYTYNCLSYKWEMTLKVLKIKHFRPKIKI